MAVIHFVIHRGARHPLCGSAEAPHWIETHLPGSVTCDACAKLLAGARPIPGSPQRPTQGRSFPTD